MLSFFNIRLLLRLLMLLTSHTVLLFLLFSRDERAAMAPAIFCLGPPPHHLSYSMCISLFNRCLLNILEVWERFLYRGGKCAQIVLLILKGLNADINVASPPLCEHSLTLVTPKQQVTDKYVSCNYSLSSSSPNTKTCHLNKSQKMCGT